MTQSNISTFSKLSVFAVTIGLSSAFIGCAKYKPASLTKPVGAAEKKNDINVSAQVLSDSECKHYFSRSVGKKGYKVVQLHIKNKSNQDLVLDASTINMSVENKDHVASRLHIDATPRVVGWVVCGLFILPFLIPFLIPAVVEAIQVSKVNKQLDRDFDSRVLDMNSKVAVNSESTLNMVFFVRKENIADTLEFSLKDSTTKTITKFSVIIA